MKTKPSILIIDDEQVICDSCHRILKDDYAVESYTSPNVGLQKALSKNYDLLLLDLCMDELDGMELLAKLRDNKKDVPVIIITGYPSDKSKSESGKLGVNDYVLKPFNPEEILAPVKSILGKKMLTQKEISQGREVKTQHGDWKSSENIYWFFKHGWMQRGTTEITRVGGQFPVLLDEEIESITFPGINDNVYRGLPLAEINLSNKIKLTIPSAITGKVVDINKELIKNPSLFETNNSINNWIAAVMPSKLEEELKKNELRKLVLFGADKNERKEQVQRLSNLGYVVNDTGSIEDASAFITNAKANVILLDVKSLADKGIGYVEKLKKDFPEVKIVVFDSTDSEYESQYHEKKIYYYAVHPVSTRELTSILYSAFCHSKDAEIPENKQVSFLPPTVDRIHITNKNGKKIALLAYNNILQSNKGTGYLLINSLLQKSYPIEINHTRTISSLKDATSSQVISNEKIKNDSIIVICKDNINKIGGCIEKSSELYENSNGQDNELLKITVQHDQADPNSSLLDPFAVRALAEILEDEMTTK